MIWLGVALLLSFGLVVLFGAPYLPTQRRQLQLAFTRLRPLTKHDLLVDLGSGDGVVLRYAARQNVAAVGYELNPFLLLLSWLLSRRSDSIQHRWRNYLRTSLPPEATVVYIFSTGHHISKLTRHLERQATELKRPLDVVSYGFALPGHQPIASHQAHRLYRITPS